MVYYIGAQPLARFEEKNPSAPRALRPDSPFSQQLGAELERRPASPGASQNAGDGQILAAANPASPAPTNEVDAYWAMQPPAVQALRNVTDPGSRMTLAQDLAGQGYSIDVPIMVWGWDPLTTMMIRQGFGYTWVPSGNQPNITTSYDPNNPPPGSIKVSTDFAKGLEQTDPWFRTFES